MPGCVCPYCGNLYSRRQGLQRHLVSAHDSTLPAGGREATPLDGDVLHLEKQRVTRARHSKTVREALKRSASVAAAPVADVSSVVVDSLHTDCPRDILPLSAAASDVACQVPASSPSHLLPRDLWEVVPMSSDELPFVESRCLVG